MRSMPFPAVPNHWVSLAAAVCSRKSSSPSMDAWKAASLGSVSAPRRERSSVEEVWPVLSSVKWERPKGRCMACR